MASLKIIPQSEITNENLDEIVRIKSIAWPYSYDQQIEWINKNLKGLDIHLLLTKNNELVGYLNLVNIDLRLDNIHYNAFGIGNVCAIEKGKGFGNELMKQTNQYLLKENRIGMLFCKESLTSFYHKFGWEKVEKINLQVAFDNTNVETMIYNCSLEFGKIIYQDPPF